VLNPRRTTNSDTASWAGTDTRVASGTGAGDDDGDRLGLGLGLGLGLELALRLALGLSLGLVVGLGLTLGPGGTYRSTVARYPLGCPDTKSVAAPAATASRNWGHVSRGAPCTAAGVYSTTALHATPAWVSVQAVTLGPVWVTPAPPVGATSSPLALNPVTAVGQVMVTVRGLPS
jgi:hypothetical protein